MAKKRKAGSTAVAAHGASQGKVAQASTSLPWSAVSLPSEANAGTGESDQDFYQGFSLDDDDYMGLTEVDNVEVVRGDDGIVKFVVSDQLDKSVAAKGKGRASDAEPKSKKAKSTSAATTQPDGKRPGGKNERVTTELIAQSEELPHFTFEEEEASVDDQLPDTGTNFTVLQDHKIEMKTTKGLPAWKKLDVSLHGLLYKALSKSKFTTPTDIQAATLPIALSSDKARGSRDVVGIAQTGSGKTLAYGLPILQWIAANSAEDRQMRFMSEARTSEEDATTRLGALVLTPTRELAIQVAKSISDLIDASSVDKSKRWASVATLTGGMSEEKQRRTLLGYKGRGVDVIVATPGRLWDVCKSDDSLVRRVKLTRFLVVDEADRMIETGHFAELENIFGLVRRSGHNPDQAVRTTATVQGGAADMQTFIYSATMSKDLQRNFHRRQRKPRRKNDAPATTLEELLEAIDFRDPEPAIVDQSTLTRIAEKVHEFKMECLQKDKDLYLYYFLLRYPGRTLIFVNAIDGIRRLQPLLENLQISVQPLHSQLQQKQRLKSMDKFRSSKLAMANGVSSVLLATDVAARGLDIPDVDHVVHFQVPRTADSYVHRSGRTARAGATGVALTLIEPSEKRIWLALCKNLQRQESAVSSLPIDYDFLPALKSRIELARQIDKATHTQKKEAHDDAWLRKMAEEADMAMSDDEQNDSAGHDKAKGKKANANVAALRSQLQSMLKTPLRARGLSFKYLTGGNSRHLLDSLLVHSQHDQMIGINRSNVLDEVNGGSAVKKSQGGGDKTNGQKRKRAES